jgi:transposase
MGKLHELTATEKGVIIGCRLSGKSIREIAVITGHPKSTVGNIVKRYEKEGHVNNQPREGRPQLMNERDKRRLVRVVVQNRHKSFSQIAAAYNEEAVTPVSQWTVRGKMRSLGFHGRAAVRKPLVSEVNRRRRLKWCKERRYWTLEQWRSIIWSDESRFTLYQTDGRVWIYRRRGERYNIDCQVPTVKHGGGSVMVWGWCSAYLRGPLVKCSNAMNSFEYKNILETHLLPSLEGMDGYTFQQDNAPIHTARLVTNFFHSNSMPVLDWVPQSPDLNPIECLWGELEKKVRKRAVQPKSLAELERFLLEEWENMPVDIMCHFVDSLPRRVAAVIKANGYATPY